MDAAGSDSRKNIVDIIVRGQRGAARGACGHSLDDLLAGQVENRLQNLRALPLAGLSHDEKNTGAVLDVMGRQELPLQQLHDHGSFGAVETARVAAAIQLGEERVRPLVVVVPELLE